MMYMVMAIGAIVGFKILDDMAVSRPSLYFMGWYLAIMSHEAFRALGWI